MRAADQLIQTLTDLGVKHIFSLSGNQIMPIYGTVRSAEDSQKSACINAMIRGDAAPTISSVTN